MIKQNLTFLRRAQLTLDLILTAFAFHLTYLVRAGAPFEPINHLIPQELYARTLIMILMVWFSVLLISSKAYEYRVRTIGFILKQTGRAVLLATALLLVLLFFTGHPPQSRITTAIFAVIDFGMLFLSRVALLKTLEHFRKKGFNYLRILIVGTGDKAKQIVDQAVFHPEWGIKPIGFVDWQKTKWLWSYRQVPLVGLMEHLPTILTNGHIDAVLFADPPDWEKLNKGVAVSQKTGVPSYLLADFLNRAPKNATASYLGWPVIPLSGPYPLPAGLTLKHFFDRLTALFGIILLAPIFLTAAVALKFSASGSVLFKQSRIGQNGRRFWMYKFCTMVEGADKMKKDLLNQNEMSGPVFKVTDDPRVTGIGKFLRKTSLDELPQLFNVLKGEMSLVGPRPPLPEEVFQYRLEHRRRLSVRPGITCLWQVTGRNNLDFESWMKLDLQYIDNWSFWSDFKILARTLPAVLTANGAK